VLGAGAAVEAGTVCSGTAVGGVEQAQVIGNNATSVAQIKALRALPMT
jgi:hypothetical protein